jgi:hypothetical protein
MYKVGDRVMVKHKPDVIKTFHYYMAGAHNWTEAVGYMALFASHMFEMCGQSGVVSEVKMNGQEVKIVFDDSSLSSDWAWHEKWLVRLKLDNKVVA